MSEPREPRDVRGPDDERDARDDRLPGDERDDRDSRELGEKMDQQERRIGVAGALFVVIGILIAGMTVIGVVAIREPNERREADRDAAVARSVETCRADNETRAAVIELVRRLEEGDGSDTASIFPIPIPPNAGADVVALIEYVNGVALAAPPEGTPEPSATELAEETLPRKDCIQ